MKGAKLELKPETSLDLMFSIIIINRKRTAIAPT
jgi:hypothetical protein